MRKVEVFKPHLWFAWRPVRLWHPWGPEYGRMVWLRWLSGRRLASFHQAGKVTI